METILLLFLIIFILLIRYLNRYESNKAELNKSEFFNELQAFFCKIIEDSVVFIHTTFSKNVANKILEEGLKFSETLHNKTHQITKDDLSHLPYVLNQHKDYGNHIIVLSIKRDLYSLILNLCKRSKINEPIEYALCYNYPNEDLNYLLPSMFVWGYIDLESLEIIENDKYMIDFDINNIESKIYHKVNNITYPNKRYK